jgi:arylsulfatase A-like enzyme
LALRYLREREPRFLFLGLGDTDEHAHKSDYPSYLRALRDADRTIGEVAIHLAELSAAGTSTMLVVTTDHGRSHDFAEHGRMWPESARVWMVASGDPVVARGRVSSPQARSLADVSATLRAVAGLPPSDAPSSGRVLSELFVPSRGLPHGLPVAKR